MRRLLPLLLAALATLGLDQASKALVMQRLPYGQPQPLLPHVWLTYVQNPGAAFSLLDGFSPAVRVPFFALASLAALAVVAWAWKSLPGRDRLSELALGLIAGGALGNLLDRLRFTRVIDFIEVGVRGVYTWPVFNVADSAVCAGVGLLLLKALRAPKPKQP
jgi:signal peptidase II